MPTITLYTLLLLGPVLCKPQYADLHVEEKQLYRSAYDSPNYDQEYMEEMGNAGFQQGHTDSIWMMKAKLKEVKEFLRTLSASLQAAKMKIKELSQTKAARHRHSTMNKPAHTYMHHHHHMPAPHYEAVQYGHELEQDY